MMMVNFQEEFAQPQIRAPIHGARIVAKTISSVVGELEPRPVRARTVLGAYRPGQVCAAEQRHLFERLEKFAIE